MENHQLIDLINKEIEQGSSREQVVSNLIFAGFSYQDIQGALNQMARNGELPKDFLDSSRQTRQTGAQIQKIKKLEESTAQISEEPSIKEMVGRYKKIFIYVSIGLIVLIGGLFTIFYLYNTSTSVILKKSLINLSSVTSGSFYMAANVDVNKDVSPNDLLIKDMFPEKITLESKGIFDISYLVAKYSLEISANDGYNADSSSQPFWDVGAVSPDGSAFYFKLNDIATSSIQNQTFVSQLLPTWVFVDITSSEPLFTVAPQKVLSRLESYRGAASSDFKSALSLLSDPLIISSVADLGSQNIGDSSYYHYKITLEPQRANEIISAFYSAAGISDGGWLKDLINNPWEIWINKSSLLPYRVLITNKTEDSSQMFDPRDVLLIISGFNAKYSIDAPAQFSPLSHILQIIQNNNQSQ